MKTQNVFSIHLPKISQKEFAISSEMAFYHAEIYYHQQKNISPILYHIDSSYTLQYHAINDNHQICGIAKGTFYLKYQIDLK